ncbi:MAG: hypothetical protein EOP86_13030 [Verrucomicrobiaceae bacterium]|nr:MAG: hypothetical protein EOP86_13030 [Verrucomicrobiaceae bacterium]
MIHEAPLVAGHGKISLFEARMAAGPLGPAMRTPANPAAIRPPNDSRWLGFSGHDPFSAFPCFRHK